ncbi:MAG: RNA polymerase sigma factor [Candidatus Kapaibacteriales bacterium]
MKNQSSKRKNSIEIRQATEDLRRGSTEAFLLLYKEYSPQIYKFCLRMLGKKEYAQDAFQETFIKVFENRTTFRGENFSAWLYTIARHVCLNMMRLDRNFEQLHDNSLPFAYTYNNDVGLNNFVQKAILQLPISLREALILREYGENSYEEIAEILGIGVSLAKVRVYRARLLLKKFLEPIAKEYYENR